MPSKFSIPHFEWKKLFSTEEFMSKVAPTLMAMPPSKERTGFGSRNGMVFDYLLLQNAPFIEHFFLETKELYDFLADSPVRDTELAKHLVQQWISNSDVPAELRNSRMVVLHHQYPALSSIKVIFSLIDSAAGPQFYVYSENGDEYLGCLENCQDKRFTIDSLNDRETWNVPVRRTLRVAINFLLYEKCFPEQIVYGVPEDIANPNHYRHQRHSGRTVKIAPQLVHSYSGKTPHFRRGYFKTLTSPRYTHKRGQVIFVQSTFVGGSASTVQDTIRKEQA